MNDAQLIDLAAAPIRKKAKIFLIVGLALLGFMLIGIIALASGAQGSEDIKGGVVGGIIGFIVMFGVPGIVFLVLAWKLKKRLGDKALLLAEGTKINDAREAAAREKERKEAELKAILPPISRRIKNSRAPSPCVK